MAEEYLKAIPDEENGHVHFVMDRRGYELFERALKRMQPLKQDSPKTFSDVKARLEGALMAAVAVMGWHK